MNFEFFSFYDGMLVLSKREIHIIINLRIHHSTLDPFLGTTSTGAKDSAAFN